MLHFSVLFIFFLLDLFSVNVTFHSKKKKTHFFEVSFACFFSPLIVSIGEVVAAVRFGFLQDRNLPPSQGLSSTGIFWGGLRLGKLAVPSPLCLPAVAWRKLSGCGRAPEFPPLHGPMSSGDGRASTIHNNFQSQCHRTQLFTIQLNHQGRGPGLEAVCDSGMWRTQKQTHLF